MQNFERQAGLPHRWRLYRHLSFKLACVLLVQIVGQMCRNEFYSLGFEKFLEQFAAEAKKHKQPPLHLVHPTLPTLDIVAGA